MSDEQYQDYPTGADNVRTSFSIENASPETSAPLAKLSWGEFLGWVMGRRSRHRIEGSSMQPLLEPGNEVLFHPQAYKKTSPRVGEVVIAKHPYQTDLVIIKRIGAIEGEHYFLLGDNRVESSDSRSFGWLARSRLLGKVTCRFI